MQAWWLWLLFARGVAAAPVDPEIIVLAFDPLTETSAGLWLGDASTPPAEVFQAGAGGLWAQVVAVPAPLEDGTRPATVGYTRGTPSATAELLEALAPDQAPFAAAGRVGPSGTATFEGHAAEGTVVHYAARVIVLGRGVPRAWVHDIGRQLGAVEADPVDLLLQAMPWLVEHWSRRGPRSAALSISGPTRAPEAIAVDGTRGLVSRLARAHLLHLATVEVPFQRARVRERCPERSEPCAVSRRALLGAARRALQVFPEDGTLLEAIAEAEELER